MSHKYRAWTERKSRRPAEDLLLNRSRGVEIACDFACREYISGKSVFCTLFHARKSVWPPGIGQRGAAGYRQTYLCASMRRKDFPHDNTRVPRRTPLLAKAPKRSKVRCYGRGRFARCAKLPQEPPAGGSCCALAPRRPAVTPYGVPQRRRTGWGKICFSSCGGGREMSFSADTSGGRILPAWAGPIRQIGHRQNVP